jgi:peptidyl-dipeptidase A
MAMEKIPHPFEEFLKDFIPAVARKSKQLNQALWILETTGSRDAADLKADLDTELRSIFSCRSTYEKLLFWQKEALLTDPLLQRQLDLLIRSFKQNLIPQDLLEEIARKEAALSYSYATFRPLLEGKKVSENEIRDILKKEKNPEKRKAAWDASKEVGDFLAPQILALVDLRNQAARSLGYPDYFQMELALQEVDRSWLFRLFEELAKKSDRAYELCVQDIERNQAERFGVAPSQLGPWAWGDPFAQEDPIDSHELDLLLEGVDIAQTSSDFYSQLKMDVAPILSRSDMYERPSKNQQAFCIHMDRSGDIRTLNNVKPSIRWLEVVLHELGHAVYELGYDPELPWLLREPPHMITTEAMALLAGRQAYLYRPLGDLVGKGPEKEFLRKKADLSLRRRQLIFSRWALVMTAFESELYRDPSQDLNALWWNLVQKYQKIIPPKGREKRADWAAKSHIGLAPVYYFSYLVGELFASSIQEALARHAGESTLSSPAAGQFLQEKLFYPGNRMRWDQLVVHVTGAPLSSDAWIAEFCS